jgi:hypothetical protein
MIRQPVVRKNKNRLIFYHSGFSFDTMQTNKLLQIISLAIAGFFNLYLGLMYLPSSEIAGFPLAATILGIICILGACFLGYHEIKNYNTASPLLKRSLVIPLALAGLLVLYNGLQFMRLFGFTKISFVTMAAGMGLCICALVLSQGEKSEDIRFYRTLLTAMIGGGIMCIGIEGILTKVKSTLMLSYGIVFVGIIILCIALYLAYQQFGQYDIKLRD